MENDLKNTPGKSEKIKFDKKKWRQQKYNKKFKVQQWEQKRAAVLKSKLNRQLEKESSKFASSGHQFKPRRPVKNVSKEINRLPKKSFHEFLKEKKETKKKLKEQNLLRRQEREKAVKDSKARKLEINKKLNKKTKKGQPVMKERMQLLYEKILKSVNN